MSLKKEDTARERTGSGSLANLRIAITRADKQSVSFAEGLKALGAEPVIYSAIDINPVEKSKEMDEVLEKIRDYDWILFTSVNAVKCFLSRFDSLKVLEGTRIGAIGPGTSAALQAYGLEVDFVPPKYVSNVFVETFFEVAGPDISGKRVLLPRADIAKNDLPDALRSRGVLVDELTVYHTVPGQGLANLVHELENNSLDAITFASSSAVRYFVQSLIGTSNDTEIDLSAMYPSFFGPEKVAIFCIGPVTADTARSYNLQVDAVATDYDVDGMIATIKDWFRATGSKRAGSQIN